jgi:hypothetical protein
MSPPMPSMPGAPGSGGAAGPPSDFSTLVAPAPAGPNPEAARIVSFMTSIRDMHMQIDSIAGEFPEASEDLEKAKTALTNSMSKVAASQSSPAQMTSQPPTF